jgi:trk system potassium uptake protein TrkH
VIVVLSVVVLSLDNFSIETNLTGTIACLNNIGPGLDLVGQTGNFAMFSWLSKLVLAFDMLAGRLELFPLLILFIPEIWKRGPYSRFSNVRSARHL